MKDQLTKRIIGAAIEVHRHLGPGLVESAYEKYLEFELNQRGLATRRQVTAPFVYKGLRLADPLRLDLLVEEKVIIEIKAVEKFTPQHEAQLLTYLRITGFRVGLLINFNCTVLRQGIRRKELPLPYPL